MTEVVHAGAVAKYCDGGWRCALIFGPSGAGKSDLALRALQAGWRLVSDDYSCVWPSGGSLWARAPEAIADRIEARGLGIEIEPALQFARACLAVVCDSSEVERLPAPETMALQGIDLPCIHLNPLEASALIKVDRALSTRREK
ncbi:MAG: serine kinase [Caulobacteraceae bacterium]|nr:serine kinase [Caulobacteraceae bacterium]